MVAYERSREAWIVCSRGADMKAEETRTGSQDESREETLDKTIADSFPTSDPPSSIPDPGAASGIQSQASFDTLIENLPPGSWAAISEQERRVVGTGATREEAIQSASGYQASQLRVIRIPQDPEAPQQAA